MGRDKQPVFRTVERFERAPERVSEGMRAWAGMMLLAHRRKLAGGSPTGAPGDDRDGVGESAGCGPN